MLFSSITFLFLFLPIMLAVYYIAPPQWKNLLLLAGSLIFYAWGEPVYIILMILSILLNYFCGMDIENKSENEAKAKRSLVFAITVNIVLLVFFKYFGFLVESTNTLFGISIPYRELALPIGISFYTFQEISYIIDVYRGKVKAQQSLVKYALYVSMFPQLVAGPIVCYGDIEKQLTARKISGRKLGQGAMLFIIGLSKKAVLANTLGKIFEEISSTSASNLTVLMAWLGCITYAFQIYFDFSGYSDMAIGLGRMFGFEFKKNFDVPYISKSITEFWRRWHISLSSWFREYVYIPLGGNHVTISRNIVNLLIVWMLTGMFAGPIVCYGDIEKQLTARKISGRKLGQGAMLFIIGLSKKAVLANTLGKIFEEISSTSASNLTVLMAWLGCITYAFQIYFDFSGYSDMAIGLGRMFGFEFKKNFDVPYISKSITEFWRRWHISLSSWFREYVYIPLGGNHVTISRNIVNLLIVWMLTGMWHGAAWNFIVWGIYYGVVLVLEKYVWGAIVDRWPSVLQHIYALVLVLVGWVFFFSPSLGAALRYLFAMVGGGAGFASKEVFFVILTHWLFYLLAVIGSTTLGSRTLRAILNVSENHTVRTVIALVVFFGMLAISVAYLIADTYNPFLYFRF